MFIRKRMICFSNVTIVNITITSNLIKFLDPNLYKEYIFERFKDGKPTTDKPEFDLRHLKF